MISLVTLGVILGMATLALLLILGPTRLLKTVRATLALWYEALRS